MPADQHDLITGHLDLARRIARQYRDRGVELHDLEQVAALALVKAAARYDGRRGAFEPYAGVSIRGELKRHFRDHAWVIRPPRSVQELRPRVIESRRELEQHDTAATVSVLAERLGVTRQDIKDVERADACFRPGVLDDAAGALQHDADLDRIDTWSGLLPALRRLGDRDRRLVLLRFVEERSQSEIGELLGISQMQVSRDLRRVLATLRDDPSVQGIAG